MKIRFLGAARTTTGSMHTISANGSTVLLDCGLYQGKRKEAFERNRHLPFDAKDIDACVLSHAHIDHSGNLPSLVRQGYRGPVHTTPATTDLCSFMLEDSAYLQKRDVEYVNKKRKRQGKNPFEPLYEKEDVSRLMEHFEAVEYEKPTEVATGIKVTLHDAGHILGSALVELEVRENGREHRVLFTGDMGRKDMPILRDPVLVRNFNTLITESTYGNRLHPPKKDVAAKLGRLVNDVCESRSKLIIPSFSVGRTQQIVYFLDELHNNGDIPVLPVYVDSPMSTRATGVHERHPECYDREATARLHDGDSPFAFERLSYITDVKDSKALNDSPGPMVIISASGMCEGGRILHHIKNNIEGRSNIILFVGYQAENTLGRRLIEGANPIKVFGDEYEVRMRIEKINALSAHADRNEMMDYFRSTGARIDRAYCVHGEIENCEDMSQALREFGVPEVIIPEEGQEVSL